MSKMDRGIFGSRELFRLRPRTAMVILITALLFAASLSLIPNLSSEIFPATVPARTAYISHVNIAIMNDAQFNSTNFPNNGVVSGNGTILNPYIISGWNINISGVNGIQIWTATAYFIIRDCYIHGGGSDIYGIYLNNSRNGILNNNTISNYKTGLGGGGGIRLDYSSNNSVANNTCLNNAYGICLDHSNDNTVSNNTCSNDHLSNYGGVYLYYSDGNTISNNTCNANFDCGISLYASNFNAVSNNICSNNSADGIEIYGGAAHSNTNNNLSWNQAWNNGQYGVRIYSDSGTNNSLWNNVFIDNNDVSSIFNSSRTQAYDNGTNNWWNSSSGLGNFWSDLTTPDTDSDGIVDWSYNLSGAAGAKDYFPLMRFSPDLYPPVTTASLAGTRGADDWFVSDVTVTLTAKDFVGGSGVDVIYYRIGTSGNWLVYSLPFVLSVDVGGLNSSTIQFYSIDKVDNTESVKNITVKIDRTSPILPIPLPLLGAIVAIIIVIILAAVAIKRRRKKSPSKNLKQGKPEPPAPPFD